MNVRVLIAMPLLWVSCHVQAAEVENGHLRVLAASCAACHGMNGNSVGGTPVLAGLDRSHFILQMQSFRDGSRSSSVMHHHAKGLTEAETKQLADFFAVQPRVTAAVLRPLKGL